jgi:hypothetical protein
MAAEAMKIGFDDLPMRGGREAVFAYEQVPFSSPLLKLAEERNVGRSGWRLKKTTAIQTVSHTLLLNPGPD